MKLLNKIWWKSRFRFYYLNLLWNYKFWLFSKKIYKKTSYRIQSEDNFDIDITGKMIPKEVIIPGRNKFIGYMFNNKIYIDNPGVKDFVDKDTWNYWIKRKFIIL